MVGVSLGAENHLFLPRFLVDSADTLGIVSSCFLVFARLPLEAIANVARLGGLYCIDQIIVLNFDF